MGTALDYYGYQPRGAGVGPAAIAHSEVRLLQTKADKRWGFAANPRGPWLSDPAKEIEGKCTFECKTVPHITLKSIAQNVALDAIFARHAADTRWRGSERSTTALKSVTAELRQKLAAKLLRKRKAVRARKSVTDADRRRWQLPKRRGASGKCRSMRMMIGPRS